MTEKNKVLPSTLYLVATPIGNLDDITLRALKVLKECDFVAAEDTRVTAKLLAAYEIKKPCVTYEEHSKKVAGEAILRRLKEGESCALVTDAGTPGISDPGEDLVRLCLENGIRVVPIPGACAAVNALIVSGFSTRRFVFEGFLEGKEREKKERLAELSADTRSIIFYEAPHRLSETLTMMAEVFGTDRRIALCREMTKLNEETLRLPLREAVAHFEKNPPRGEFVLVLEGASDKADVFWQNLTVAEHVAYYTDTMGLEKMAAVKAAARDRGVAKNVIYKELL
jgi:16S rRNA (cytidine1402-2'-O)-methyltransferase